MSLVKSKELKSSNRKLIKKRCITILYIFFVTLFPLLVQAQTTTEKVSSTESLLQIVLSLIVVIGVILALAWLMRRFTVAQAGGGQLKVVASLIAGSKEKVIVIEVGNEQHLLGITASNINHLAKLETPLEVKKSEDKVTHSRHSGFQQKLAQAMAHTMMGASNKEKS